MIARTKKIDARGEAMARRITAHPCERAQALDVHVRLLVHDLVQVDVTKHRLTIDFMIEVEWQDQWPDSADSLKRKIGRREHGYFPAEDWEGMFPFITSDNERLRTPRLSFENCLDLKGAERWVSVAWTNQDGPTVTYRLRALGEFYERYELWAFPFDSQDLQLVLISSYVDLYAYVDNLNAVPVALQLRSDPDRSNVNSKFSFFAMSTP
jgi:hypothetical protein